MSMTGSVSCPFVHQQDIRPGSALHSKKHRGSRPCFLILAPLLISCVMLNEPPYLEIGEVELDGWFTHSVTSKVKIRYEGSVNEWVSGQGFLSSLPTQWFYFYYYYYYFTFIICLMLWVWAQFCLGRKSSFFGGSGGEPTNMNYLVTIISLLPKYELHIFP